MQQSLIPERLIDDAVFVIEVAAQGGEPAAAELVQPSHALDGAIPRPLRLGEVVELDQRRLGSRDPGGMLLGLLLGAVVASSDAAAVFATLRFTPLRRRLARVLEAESGGNDPFAVALTLGIIGWIQGEVGAAGFGALLVGQLALGLVLGVLLGLVAAWGFARMPPSMDPYVPVASIATAALSYGLTDVAHGSGFLAVYVVGLFVGNTRSPFRHRIVSFHQGLAFLAQVVLFVVLGLLVFPSELLPVALPGIALTLVLLFVARPVAVWLSTLGQGFTRPELALQKTWPNDPAAKSPPSAVI